MLKGIRPVASIARYVKVSLSTYDIEAQRSSVDMDTQNESRREWTITLLGDIMLGRLIDQLLPLHVSEPEEARIVSNFRKSQPYLQSYTYASPWGNSVSFLKKSDLLLGNLETAATTHDGKWPDKVFNYRMHPSNVKCLLEVGMDYVSLANNHTLDFGKEGLIETVKTMKSAGIAFAGAGETEEEAKSPAILRLRSGKYPKTEISEEHEIHLYSFSDHPTDWSAVPEFNLLQYGSSYRSRMKSWLSSTQPETSTIPALKIVSIHWGPNYAWQPEDKIISLAHFLIDECGVDIIHGHSSHHLQGVEVYKKKLIIYGCGDFVDDYALTPEYRNDLSAAWNVIVAYDATLTKLQPIRLEVFPNRIRHFQAGLLEKEDADHDWIRHNFVNLCQNFGTLVKPDLGSHGQIIVNIENS